MCSEKELQALRPNVGYLLREPAGCSRPLDIDLRTITLPDGFYLDSLQGQLRLTRTLQGIWVNGVLSGKVPAQCARCLAPIALLVGVQLEELFYYPASAAPDAWQNVIRQDGCLDLVEPVREQLEVSVPMRPLCRPDCRGFCSQCGQDLNVGECDCSDEAIDPRLASLGQLKQLRSDD